MQETVVAVTPRWQEDTFLMRRQTRSVVIFGWIFAGLLWSACPLLHAQTKNDSDASDAAAFQQKLQAAHDAKIPLKARDSLDKTCFTGVTRGSSDGPRADCVSVAFNYPQYKELLLLKGCSFPDEVHQSDSCLILARMYVEQGRYLEALAVYKSPDIRNGLDSFYGSSVLGDMRETYHALGNATAELAVLKTMCSKYGNYIACLNLKDLGVQVDLAAASDQADRISEQDDRLRAQAQADKQEAANEKRQHSQATINAIYSAVGVTSQPSGVSPSSPSYGNVQGGSGTPDATDPQSSGSCRDMSACVKVVSSAYDSTHFLHVVVQNTCGVTIVAMVSVYAQNRSCTQSTSANLASGQTSDMGSLTDRNHYSILASDNIFINGSYRYPNGCSITPNDCDGR